MRPGQAIEVRVPDLDSEMRPRNDTGPIPWPEEPPYDNWYWSPREPGQTWAEFRAARLPDWARPFSTKLQNVLLRALEELPDLNKDTVRAKGLHWWLGRPQFGRTAAKLVGDAIGGWPVDSSQEIGHIRAQIAGIKAWLAKIEARLDGLID
jgi:hypothetical protein